MAAAKTTTRTEEYVRTAVDEIPRLDNRELAEKENVAAASCKEWTAELRTLQENPPWWTTIVDPTGVARKHAYDVAFARQSRDGWCALTRIYQAEAQRRAATDPSMQRARQEVAEELGAMREEHREEARRISREYEERGGAFGATGYAAAEAVREGTMGFFSQVRENIFRTVGLGSDQSAEERVVGLIRLGLAMVAIYLVYVAAGRFLGAGAGVMERGAERMTKTLVELKDVPLGG